MLLVGAHPDLPAEASREAVHQRQTEAAANTSSCRVFAAKTVDGVRDESAVYVGALVMHGEANLDGGTGCGGDAFCCDPDVARAV